MAWHCAPLSSSLPGKQSLWRRGQGCTGPCSKAEQNRAGGEAAREDGRTRTANLWATREQQERQGISKSLPPPASLKDEMSLRHQLLPFHFHYSVLTTAGLLRGQLLHLSPQTAPRLKDFGFWSPQLMSCGASRRSQLAQSAGPPSRRVTVRASSREQPREVPWQAASKTFKPFSNGHFQRLEKEGKQINHSI